MHGAAGFKFIRRHLFKANVLGGSKSLEVFVGTNNVGVAGHCPETRPVRFVDPGNRIFLSKSLKCRMGHSFHEGVVRGQVGVRVTQAL